MLPTVEQTTGGQMTTETGTLDGIAPPVRSEPCVEARVDHASAWPVCEACGWLDDDHATVETATAVVRELPRRRAPMPARKAS
jgi:hypothetical protein